MSKTTLELLIESYEYRLGVLLSEDSTDENLGQISEIEKCIQEAEDLLQSEREQIIEAYRDGVMDGDPILATYENGEDYFTQTYKKD